VRAWLFPGQGSQRPGMGGDLFAAFPDLVAEANDILGYSVVDACQGDRLRRTEYVQPLMFVVSALACLARRAEEGDPDVVAGHSLGELTALWAAGCYDFGTALRLVRRRGELMGEVTGGGMTAVVGLDVDALTAVLGPSPDVDIANHNAADQIVLSGPLTSLNALAPVLRAAGGRCVPLPVSAPFHSRYMRPVADRFASELRTTRFAPPRIPVIANATAAPYPADGIADLLVRQIYSPVRWRDSMRTLIDSGVDQTAEIGPGNVLTRLWELAPRVAPPGSARFREVHGVRHACLAGSMYHGVASTDLVIRLGRAGLMGFFGAGGLALPEVARAIGTIRAALGPAGRFGVNLLHDLDDPTADWTAVDMYLRNNIRYVEAAAYTAVTPALVRFRFTGAHRVDGHPVAVRHVVAKVAHPDLGTAFLSPPPAAMLDNLVQQGQLTAAEADVARELPVSADVCVEADSGGHTDGGVALVLVPAFVRLRDTLADRFGYLERPRIGASGGLGSPEAVAAVFVLGADFVVTGSINQCTPEAGTSALVKDMLAELDVHDTAYAPAGDMFELGAKVQVVRRGTLFAARATKLYQLYRTHESLAELDSQTTETLERTYFRRSLDSVWEHTRRHHLDEGRTDLVGKAEANPKLRMALVFRSYFARTTLAALAGDRAEKVNFQVHCGPAMGAFNRFVAGTDLADWRARHVDVIADRLMTGAAAILENRTGRRT
jgi:trans-AT polyketide synthase/acyltransferase/oxidoreductase domain-containing protein